MSDAWTPSTEQVRSHYVFDQGDRWDAERGESFDRWLAEHDREVAENAWDHCLEEIEQNEINTTQAREGNPYRQASTDTEGADRG